MARVTVFIPDHLLDAAVDAAGRNWTGVKKAPTVSGVVQEALKMYSEGTGRPEVSERGRLETLRTTRAARVALEDLERMLVESAPVRRRVRRAPSRARSKRGT